MVMNRLSPMMQGVSIYHGVIAHPQFNLSISDVAALMNACPFDSFNTIQPSPICSLFTAQEWLGYNYAYDLTQFGERPHNRTASQRTLILIDNAGYGGPIGTAWGVGWVAEMIARRVVRFPPSVGCSTLQTQQLGRRTGRIRQHHPGLEPVDVPAQFVHLPRLHA